MSSLLFDLVIFVVNVLLGVFFRGGRFFIFIGGGDEPEKTEPFKTQI